MTFLELYQQAVETPSPRQLFIQRIARATNTSLQVVEHWVYGKRVPRKGAREMIASELGIDEDILFPTHKVARVKRA